MFDNSIPIPATGNLSDPLLWDRIRIAPLPVSKSRHDFAEALAYEIDLPVFEAREVVEEYRRFLYLAAITDELRVPPNPVCHAWSMHAHSPEYTAFCAGTVCKPLGLDDGARKFGANAAYRRTLDAYAREFGQTAPPAIWPPMVRPRMPRWLTVHAVVLGFTGMVAWELGEPLLFAAGLGTSLAIYGLDVYAAHLRREGPGLSADLSDDLAFFLSGKKGR